MLSVSNAPYSSFWLVCLLLAQFAPGDQAFLDLHLAALLRWFVIAFLCAEVILRDEMIRVIVAVFVAFAVAKPRGSGIMRIAKMLGNGECAPAANVLQCGINGDDAAVAFWGGGDVEGGFSDGNAGFGP